jgi:hypothetical protein
MAHSLFILPPIESIQEARTRNLVVLERDEFSYDGKMVIGNGESLSCVSYEDSYGVPVDVLRLYQISHFRPLLHSLSPLLDLRGNRDGLGVVGP